MIEGFEEGKIHPIILFLKDGPAVKVAQGKGIETIVHQGKTFWTTPGPKWNQLGSFYNMKALIPDFKLRKIIKTISPNLIHINDKAALNAGISAIGLKVPIVQHLRSTYYICNFFLNKWLSKLFIQLYSDLNIAISEDEAIDFNRKKTKIVFNSLDTQKSYQLYNKRSFLREKLGFDNHHIHVGWVGKFNNVKGAWDFMEAAYHLKKLFPTYPLKFHMLAKLPDANQMEIAPKALFGVSLIPIIEKISLLIKEYELENDIVLHDFKPNILEYMTCFDISINCNRSSAFGRQAFETISVGTASVVTAKYLNRSSVIKNEVSALVAKEGDIDDIVKLAAKLIENKSLRIKLSENGLKIAKEQFDFKIQSQKITQLYKELIR